MFATSGEAGNRARKVSGTHTHISKWRQRSIATVPPAAQVKGQKKLSVTIKNDEVTSGRREVKSWAWLNFFVYALPSIHCLYFIYARKIYMHTDVKIMRQWKSSLTLGKRVGYLVGSWSHYHFWKVMITFCKTTWQTSLSTRTRRDKWCILLRSQLKGKRGICWSSCPRDTIPLYAGFTVLEITNHVVSGHLATNEIATKNRT